MARPVVLAHGGAGSPSSNRDGPERAARRGLEVLLAGGSALDAVLATTVDLEDDPRFNAGTGSNLRLDGHTIEMDAGVMTSDGRSGAVAGLPAVKNPILVAAAVRARTNHVLLCGEGALRFARKLGFGEHDPLTDRARAKLAKARQALRGTEPTDDSELEKWRKLDLPAIWNFDRDVAQALTDTVGAVARDGSGGFAATASTGGTVLMLRGRVGDSPIVGAGFYAGPAGAVACTGIGEEIVRRFAAKTVYDLLAQGVRAEEAARRGVALFPGNVDAGILVVGAEDHAVASNRDMAAGTAEAPP